MPTPAFPKVKRPALAAGLAVIFGPLGYFYFGWRYALAATIVFVLFIAIFSQVLFVPTWLKYINVPVFAFMAVVICRIRNDIINAEHDDAFAFNTFPVAVFAMTSLLPILAVIDTIAVGIAVAVQRIIEAQIGKGILILLVATPFLAFVQYFVFSIIAAGIDRLTLRCARTAPTNIFPVSIGRRETAR